MPELASGRLNLFQQTMLDWNDLHPYNAVHIVRIPSGLDLGRLRGSLETNLQALGLTNLTLDRKRSTYHYREGPAACDLQVIQAGPALRAALDSEIQRQLNLRFDYSRAFQPFRFFVAGEPDGFYLGMAYFHPVADAESIVRLLKFLSEGYQRSTPSPVAMLERYPPSYDGVFRHPKEFFRKLCAFPASTRKLRRSYRLQYRDTADFANGFISFTLPLVALPALVSAGKSWGVTINDLLLTLLMQAFARQLPGRLNSARRRLISLGCIVNIRPDLQLDKPSVFGLFLGSFLVSSEVPEGLPLPELAKQLSGQTRDIKRRRLYLATPFDLLIARGLLAMFSTSGRRKFYQKNYPLCGGITNMQLNALWNQPAGEKPVDYFRAVSTGPATPMVLSVTTIRDRINVGLSYRRTVFSDETVARVKEQLLAGLEQLPTVA